MNDLGNQCPGLLITLADSDNYIRVLVEFAAEYAHNNYL